MNVAVLTYEFADPAAVQAGCPKDWPQHIHEIGDSTELPEGLKPPWKVMARSALDASMKSMEASKETYNNREAVLAKQAEETKKSETVAVISEIESVFKTWESADEKSRGEILHKMLYLILEALKSLGAPVGTIEKPTAK